MDERDRLSLIGHAGMAVMGPLHEHELLALLEGRVAPGDRLLDLGGGRGDLALLCAQRFGCRAITVDRSPATCEEARRRVRGASVEVVCDETRAYLARESPRGLALACVVGALHAFGTGIASWTNAIETLAPLARAVLVADIVATGPLGARTFDVARASELEPLERKARARLVLPSDRVVAYEQAWCDAVAASPVVRDGDPRAEWVRERLAWSERTRDAWRELAFVALWIEPA